MNGQEFQTMPKELAVALMRARSQFPPIDRDATAKIPTKSGGSYTYKYATFDQIVNKTRPLLQAEGLDIIQIPRANNGSTSVLTRLVLVDTGEYIEGEVAIHSQQDTPQGEGSGITYARRYGWVTICGIIAETDDDAQAAMPGKRPENVRKKQTPPKPGTPAAKEFLEAEAILKRGRVIIAKMKMTETAAKALMDDILQSVGVTEQGLHTLDGATAFVEELERRHKLKQVQKPVGS